jgi:hypothetical protein
VSTQIVLLLLCWSVGKSVDLRSNYLVHCVGLPHVMGMSVWEANSATTANQAFCNIGAAHVIVGLHAV